MKRQVIALLIPFSAALASAACLVFPRIDSRAIRSADWTLAEVDGSGWELFLTAVNPLETKKVSAGTPAIASDHDTRWMPCWSKENGRSSPIPESIEGSPHDNPQGERRSGQRYAPWIRHPNLSNRDPVP